MTVDKTTSADDTKNHNEHEQTPGCDKALRCSTQCESRTKWYQTIKETRMTVTDGSTFPHLLSACGVRLFVSFLLCVVMSLHGILRSSHLYLLLRLPFTLLPLLPLMYHSSHADAAVKNFIERKLSQLSSRQVHIRLQLNFRCVA